MVDQPNISPNSPEYTQLSQVQVPLEKASEVFSQRDASGRMPIVIIPVRLNRIRNEVVGLGLLVGVLRSWVELAAEGPCLDSIINPCWPGADRDRRLPLFFCTCSRRRQWDAGARW